MLVFITYLKENIMRRMLPNVSSYSLNVGGNVWFWKNFIHPKLCFSHRQDMKIKLFRYHLCPLMTDTWKMSLFQVVP